MRILVSGSSGHLGEALMRSLDHGPHEAIGLDVLPSPFTTHVGSITDAGFVRRCMQGVDAVLHAATLHKPHVATHGDRIFVDTNIVGTLHLLEAAVAAGVGAFVFTSTTSTFGDALTPPAGAPAAWITEAVMPIPKNIYGVTKVAAEDLCQLFSRNEGLPCVVLRTSRFFPEDDDNPAMLRAYGDANNLKVNEFLHRRVDIEDVVSAHLLALERAPALKFAKFIISATTPFTEGDGARLRLDPSALLRQRFPAFEAIYAKHGWKAPHDIDRVYVNARARTELGWQPSYDFERMLQLVHDGLPPSSELARLVGAKGYHR
jgi:nucleoside-diphosphate-sugar epimerase